MTSPSDWYSGATRDAVEAARTLLRDGATSVDVEVAARLTTVRVRCEIGDDPADRVTIEEFAR